MKSIFSLFFLSLLALSFSQFLNENILESFENKDPKELFVAFHSFYERKYDINSEIGREKYKVFLKNLGLIKEVNSKNLTYKYGITPFVDLTREEFIRDHLVDPAVLKSHMHDFLKLSHSGIKVENTPQSTRNKIDWESTFLEPRNQLQCGSCWAFATAGTVEANWWKNNKNMDKIYVSPQQLVDCDKKNHGCNGGWYHDALDYTYNEGLIQDSLYPYTGNEGECNVPSQGVKLTIDKYYYCEDCQINDWYNLLSYGPIAVAVDATQFQFYKGGVVKLENCGQLNHAVIAIGWESFRDGDVITLRNSWSTQWGEKGYMRVIYQEQGHTCSITNYAFLPESKMKSILKKPPKNGCFTLKKISALDGVKLKKGENTDISFKGKGNGIEIEAFSEIWKSIFEIKIAGWHGSTTKISKNGETICEWKFSIDSEATYNYQLVYSKDGISLYVNDIKFVCNRISDSIVPVYMIFGGRGNSKMCDLKINN